MEIHEIIPGLFQSSKIQASDVITLDYHKIDVIIDLEGGFDTGLVAYLISFYLYHHLFDIPILPNISKLWHVAGFGWRCLDSKMVVLTHCTMGHNRSGLINGMILKLMGMPGPEIVKLIQEKVPGALTNSVFRNYLESLI